MQILSIVRRFLREHRISGAGRQYIPLVFHQVPSPSSIFQRFALWPFAVRTIGPAVYLFRPGGETSGTSDWSASLRHGLDRRSAPKRLRFWQITGLFFKGPFRQIIDLQSRLDEFEQTLGDARNIEQCWVTIQTCCREFGFSGGRLSARGRVFESPALPAGLNSHWHLRIPLAEAQYLNLYHDPEAEDHPAVLGRLTGILRDGLRARFAEWGRVGR